MDPRGRLGVGNGYLSGCAAARTNRVEISASPFPELRGNYGVTLDLGRAEKFIARPIAGEFSTLSSRRPPPGEPVASYFTGFPAIFRGLSYIRAAAASAGECGKPRDALVSR